MSTFAHRYKTGRDIKETAFMGPVQELELVIKAKGGDVPAQKQLILNFMPLVRNMTVKYNKSEDYDDQVQNGVLALYHALGKFDPTKGARFATYARHWIAYYHQCHRSQPMLAMGANPLPGEDLGYYDNGYMDEMGAGIERSIDDKTVVDRIHEYLSDCMGVLSEREQKIISRKINKSPSQAALAKELGISKQRVHQIEHKLMAQLRAAVTSHIKGQDHD